MKVFLPVCFALFLLKTTTVFSQSKNPLENILQQNPDLFATLLNHPQRNEIQILYTQVNRDKHNKAHFKTFGFNVDNHHYFYPASTIKLPTAIFALEKLNELNIKNLNKDTELQIDSNYISQTRVSKDLSSETSKASIANYIKKNSNIKTFA